MGHGFVQKPAIVTMDNKGAIFMIRNHQTGQRTRHIDIRHHWMRNLQAEKEIDVIYRNTLDNASDIETKNLPSKLFHKHTKMIRNLNNDENEDEEKDN